MEVSFLLYATAMRQSEPLTSVEQDWRPAGKAWTKGNIASLPRDLRAGLRLANPTLTNEQNCQRN